MLFDLDNYRVVPSSVSSARARSWNTPLRTGIYRGTATETRIDWCVRCAIKQSKLASFFHPCMTNKWRQKRQRTQHWIILSVDQCFQLTCRTWSLSSGSSDMRSHGYTLKTRPSVRPSIVPIVVQLFDQLLGQPNSRSSCLQACTTRRSTTWR